MREAVTRSAWDDSQGNLGADKGRTHLIDGTIAACHREDVEALFDGFLGKQLGVTGVFGDTNLILES